MGRLLPRLVPAVFLLCTAAACSGVNLGNIDETPDSREEMPGPGIFADAQGKSELSWSSDRKAPEPSSSPAPVSSSAATLAQEKAEFEQFKIWNELRTKGADSAEYREFLQWLEYQKFKSGQ
jgi:hypothetical protein